MIRPEHLWTAAIVATLAIPTALSAAGSGDHQHGEAEAHEQTESQAHEHMEHMEGGGHDHSSHMNSAEAMSHEEKDQTLGKMADLGLALPRMDPERGRELFLDKGCVACHQVNGVGGQVGPALDADGLPTPLALTSFASRMWNAAPAMTRMQQDMLGETVTLTPDELADITAFAHDDDAQAELSESQVPDRYRELITN